MHIAIIPDGNRRWAKAKKFHPWKGHEQAIENFRSITEFCRKDPRIDILTVWCFSTENWKRDPKEIAELFRMLEEYLRKERKGFIEQHTRFLHSGRRDRIPKTLSNVIAEVEHETADQKEFTLHLAVDYGGKDEILRAIKKILCARSSGSPAGRSLGEGWKTAAPRLSNLAYRQAGRGSGPVIDDQTVQSLLDQPHIPDIDLIIRTSGEQRTSNFFLWQTLYAEWFFSARLFPDFTVEDMKVVLEDFERRKRRFGS